jgi:aldose 1-epimerase
LVPDNHGGCVDVVLGFDDANGYRTGNGGFLGATVGRNANRIKGASFMLDDTKVRLTPNEGKNNLHSGPDFYHHRMWDVVALSESSITLHLYSPHGDQGFPGNAHIQMTYTLEGSTLRISYEAIADHDTVFNMTNHSYFNLAGHQHPEKAYDQILSMAARFYTPTDAGSIPTGEMRSVAGTPMDFRAPKRIGRDAFADDEQLKLANGYDHNFEVFCNPCAILSDPESGRTLAISTDCPGIQFYAGNFLKGKGKGGIEYGERSGIALETQYFPNAMNQPGWKQPIVKAGQKYKSTTTYKFTW